MYLNEKAWEIQQNNPYEIDEALKRFLDIYAALAGKFRMPQVFVPEDAQVYLRASYSIEQWLAESDLEYRRLFLSFWNKRILYTPDDECELSFGGEHLKGGTEAFLNRSFLLSICLDKTWKKELIEAEKISLPDLLPEVVSLNNVFCREQLFRGPIADILNRHKKIEIYSYQELWKRRQQLFPHLKFCPSVERDFENLEKSYLNQVVKKLFELDLAAEKGFVPSLLTKTTTESEATLNKYTRQHMFTDEEGHKYLAKWHMRFTGIPGRIFFVPDRTKGYILVCYIGKKLPNVSYPT